MPASHQSSKDGRRTKIHFWFTLEPQHKDLNLAWITHSRANLVLTFTKLVLRTKDLIFMLLDGLEVFLDVYEMS